ncbi:MAG: hypothetical protein UW35_C0006G0007 [Candidatus Collierbacteria bacterium GW2011_GWF2_44_15]|uniref:Transcription factor zinc-finger domain-containing protein n=4 Tax=Candidatus Collieribacteriota TaxID=1752725 RepID=A0A0G1JSM8_9BACT|nr:MAG: hypothetical protein UW26_C0003G0024 [Candidatus Collierbacteria bacterium GW2011_GWF1_44_12]KKT46902.1 MAG: hypothetical protein UW35_C0006G0007 [Candidatus Collierbacteria bacterium GW2011_GWF2_44_15]KKU27597.1 MAG: hypothetical protein UX41_C0047G0005 [Candidatus Collierbacteria bacterium GW2011_GWE1_46_18]
MTCPHCGAEMHTIEIETIDGQPASVNECLNCGGHLLAPVLGNFISSNTAKNIDSIIPKATSVPTHSPICTHCQQTMSSIKDDSVPQTVTVFSCPNNHGDFYPKDQLIQFKKAQDAKINYHKLWGIPVKSAFAVLIPVVIIFTAITVIPNVLKSMRTSQETRVTASEILTSPLITPITSTEVLISFSTRQPSKTNIRFTQGSTSIYEVSTKEDTSHLLSVPNLLPSTSYKYVIEIIVNDKTLTTDEYTFSTP